MSWLNDTPKPVLAVGALATGGGVLAALGYLLGPVPATLFILGAAVVVVIVFLYHYFLKLRDKRRAASMEQDVEGNARRRAVNLGSEDIKRSDEFAGKFREGLEEFKKHGQSIYDLPWYAIIGEPASGKTKALQKSGLRFPSFMLEKGLPGSGGTLAMDWFFTEEAVILDTAGRVVTEKVEAGATGPWREFLQQLKKNRPLCPLNGVILVIPADKLGTREMVRASIREGEQTIDKSLHINEYIEHMAPKLALRLEQMQRDLGVRLPIFVLVTKSDLIHGFREFFAGVTDLSSQSQIFGWSYKPANLDEAFLPSNLDSCFDGLNKQLRRRRLGLLMDTRPASDPNAARLDEVDDFYDFPRSFKAIEPYLRRYLELILPKGKWTTKNPFFRGIYFTSSLQEGDALDDAFEKLAGHPPPESNRLALDRPIFLQDVFTKKILVEQGLVTNANDTRRMRSRRRLVLVTATCVSILLLIGLSVWSAVTLENRIGRHADVFAAVNDNINREIIGDCSYAGSPKTYVGDSNQVEVGGESVKLSRLPVEAAELVQHPIRIPFIFRWIGGGNLLKENFQSAYAVFVERTIYKPLVDAVRVKLKKKHDWTPEDTNALGQLIRIEAVAAGKLRAGKGAPLSPIDTDVLMRYVLDTPCGKDAPVPYTKFESDANKKPLLASLSAAEVYPDGDVAADWMDSENQKGLVKDGVDRFIKSIDSAGGADSSLLNLQSSQLKMLIALQKALLDYQTAFNEIAAIEGELLELDRRPFPAFDAFMKDEWTPRMPRLTASAGQVEKAAGEIDRLLKELKVSMATWEALAAVFDEAARQARQTASESFEQLQAEADYGGSAAQGSLDLREHLDATKATLIKASEQSQTRITEQLNSLRKNVEDNFKLYQSKPPSLVLARYKMYQVAGKALATSGLPTPILLTNASDALDKIDKDSGGARTDIRVLSEKAGLADKDPVVKLANDVADFGAGNQRLVVILRAVEETQKDPNQFGQLVSKLAEGEADLPLIPYSKGLGKSGQHVDRQFDAAAANRFLTLIRKLQAVASASSDPEKTKVLNAAQVAGKLDDLHKKIRANYIPDYFAYWHGIWGRRVFDAPAEWPELRSLLGGLQRADVTRIFEGHQTLNDQVGKALSKDIRAECDNESTGHDWDACNAQLEAEAATLRRNAYRADCETVLENLRSLPTNAEEAAQKLGPLSAAAFSRDYLACYDELAGTEYWNSLLLHSLERLTAVNARVVREAKNKLIAMRRFPLYVDPEARGEFARPMSPDELDKAWDLLKKLPTDSGQDNSGQSLDAGDRKGLSKKISAQLDSLFGTNIFPQKEKDWLRKLKKLVAVLIQARGGVCKVSLYERAQQQSEGAAQLPPNAVGRYGYIRIKKGAQVGTLVLMEREAKPEDVRGAFEVADMKLENLGTDRASKEVAFEVCGDDKGGAPTGKSRTMSSLWNVVEAIHEPNAIGPRAGEPGWKVPLIFTDDQNKTQKSCYWVRLEFSPDLPTPEMWITKKDFWPGDEPK